MKLYGWAAALILTLVTLTPNDEIRPWAIWGIAVVALVTIAFAVEQAFGPWIGDISEDHPDALGSLDIREREGWASESAQRERWAAVVDAFEPVGEDRTP